MHNPAGQDNQSVSATSHDELPWLRQETLTYCHQQCCDTKNLLHIIQAAGGRIPRVLGEGATMWGEDGVAVPVDTPVPDVLGISDRYNTAIDTLLKQGDILTYDNTSMLAISPRTKPYNSKGENQLWKTAALAGICRAFPRWPNPGPTSAERCKSLLPLLPLALSYFPNPQLLSNVIRESVAEVCISASYFGLLSWKKLMLDTAVACNSADLILQYHLSLRKKMLNRLQRQPHPARIDFVQSRASPRSNGFFGRGVLLEAKQLLDRDAPIDEIRTVLNRFQPGTTPFEKHVDLEGKAILARAHKNQGLFEEACTLYEKLISISTEANANLSNDIVASYIEVLCELGKPDEANNFLRSEWRFNEPTRGSRLQLVTSYTDLVQCLLKYPQTIDHFHLNDVYFKLQTYQKNMTRHLTSDLTIIMKSNIYTAFAGQAMVRHLQSFDTAGNEGERCEDAKLAWQQTQNSAFDCWPQPGFAEMVALFSLSDLECRLGKAEEASKLRDKATHLYREVGRRYHFLAQGTIWLRILESRGIIPEEFSN